MSLFFSFREELENKKRQEILALTALVKILIIKCVQTQTISVFLGSGPY